MSKPIEPYYKEPTQTIYCGHTLDVLKALPSESVDCVLTSPPYWRLRYYKTEPIVWGNNHCEHEWVTETFRQHAGRGDCQRSAKYSELPAPEPDMILNRSFCVKCNAWYGELGMEPTVEMYIDHLLQIFDEIKRVLKKTGTCWVNIGDSFAGNKPPGSLDRDIPDQIPNFRNNLTPKSLCGVPERFTVGMLERGWIKRNTIIWLKPNAMPESVKDRFTEDFEYLYFFVKNPKYWFEQQLEEYPKPLARWNDRVFRLKNKSTWDEGTGQRTHREGRKARPNPTGRNKRCVWAIPTEPFTGAHFAVFPEKLCETPIRAGCPNSVCVKCGKPRWKQAECSCNADFEPGVVLDPFCGSGTALVIAKRLGRRGIGIDLSREYCDLTIRRLQTTPLPLI